MSEIFKTFVNSTRIPEQEYVTLDQDDFVQLGQGHSHRTESMQETTLVLYLLFVKTRINVSKFSKASVTSWVFLSASLFLCGCAKWTLIPRDREDPFPSPLIPVEDYLVCHTNNTKITDLHKRQLETFQAKVTDNMVVFIASSRSASKILPVKEIITPCELLFSDYIYMCCKYSPNHGLRKEIQTHIGSYQYDYHIDEGSFQIEHLFLGRNRRISQSLTITTDDFRISTEHKSSADVPNDPYPEVHIAVTTLTNNKTNVYNFHWYL